MWADSILYFCDNLLLAGVSRELRLRLKTKWQLNYFIKPCLWCSYGWIFSRRISVPDTLVDMLIGRLRSDDVYNQVSYVVFLYLSNQIVTQVLYISY